MIQRLIYAIAGVLAACAVSFGVTMTSTPGGFSRLNIQTFCALGCDATAGPYVPSAGTVYIDVTCVGGGGGGGGVTGTAANNRQGAGGGGGAYSRAIVPVTASSYAITLGASGAGVSAADGGDGGATSVGSVCTAAGGLGGGNVGTGSALSGSAAAVANTGYLFFSPGWVGSNGINTGTIPLGWWAGQGGSTMVAGANIQTRTGAGLGSEFNAGYGWGTGGGGAGQWQVAANSAGGSGGTGYVLIVEYMR